MTPHGTTSHNGSQYQLIVNILFRLHHSPEQSFLEEKNGLHENNFQPVFVRPRQVKLRRSDAVCDLIIHALLCITLMMHSRLAVVLRPFIALLISIDNNLGPLHDMAFHKLMLDASYTVPVVFSDLLWRKAELFWEKGVALYVQGCGQITLQIFQQKFFKQSFLLPCMTNASS